MRSMRLTGALAALVFLFNAAACEPQPTNTSQQPATNATNTAPGPATPVSTGAAPMPVTLPVLEALFYDDAFANEVKSTLQLTDEQIDRLKTIAREAREGLREGETDDEHAGTTADARRRAEEGIKAAIGEEKTKQLFRLAGERWDGAAGETAATTKPGTVPTDTRIVVNAPAYRMDVFEGGRLVKSYKVGIGYPEFPLPTGLRTADTIIFNPTWTPPDEPWVESSNKVKVGETIKAGDERNPLGPVKIPIGLPSLIHGGKSPSKLGGFASHGCVGLTTPQVFDFTKVLARLGGAEIADQQIAEYQKNKTETKNVKLGTPIPVELRYETITVEDGKLHVYRDVYDRNTNTEENLRAVLEAYGVSLDQLSEGERTKALGALREMSRDAKGRLDTPGATNSNGNGNGNANGNGNRNGNANANGNTSPNPRNQSNTNASGSGSVTTAVKGQKEVVVEVAGLQGKGYPAPVELDAGGGAAKPGGAGGSGTPSRRRNN